MDRRPKNSPVRAAYASSGTDWKGRVQERQRAKQLLAMQVGLRVKSTPATREGCKSILYFGRFGLIFCRDHEPCLMFGVLDANVFYAGRCAKCPPAPPSPPPIRGTVYTFKVPKQTMFHI